MMKKKYIAVMMGVMLTAAVLSGCGQSKETKSTKSQTTEESAENFVNEENNGQNQKDEEKIFGEITKVEEDSITIALGTRKQMEPPQDAEDLQSQEENDRTKGTHTANLELTGEEQTIAVTENTVITRVTPGGMGGNRGQERDSQELEKDMKDMPEKSQGDVEKQPEGERPDVKQEAEEISLSDIVQGDTVSITLDEEGNAATIMVETIQTGELSES